MVYGEDIIQEDKEELEATNNVVDIRKSLKIISGGGDNWLGNLKAGTVFISRRLHRMGIPEEILDCWQILFHTNHSTALSSHSPVEIKAYVDTALFSKNNKFYEIIGEVSYDE